MLQPPLLYRQLQGRYRDTPRRAMPAQEAPSLYGVRHRHVAHIQVVCTRRLMSFPRCRRFRPLPENHKEPCPPARRDDVPPEDQRAKLPGQAGQGTRPRN